MGSTPNPGLMKIRDTLTGNKDTLEPIHNNSRVNLFVCGPTVYDDSHIGHARTYIVFDVVARYLKYRGFSVFYLQNITDVDDKIIQRASERETSPTALARKYERRYLEDMRALGVTNVNYYARATEHIPEIISQIQRLIDKGFAYETESGIYFDESRFQDFGKLSHQNAEELLKHRVEPDPTKRNPGDFSLWKKRQDGEGVTWDSPWGKGRPGWHIEDTAITENYFGAQYDIHGGARDLIFPHHEAEIAQMEAVSGKKPLVRHWMHTGFLNVGGEKMSKSLGNFTTIREMLEKYDADAFRLFVLLSHYSSPIDFSQTSLEQAGRSLERIRQTARIIEKQLEAEDAAAVAESAASSATDQSGGEGEREGEGEVKAPAESSAPEERKPGLGPDDGHNGRDRGDGNQDGGVHGEEDSRARFLVAMDNDFNTPYALKAVFDLARNANRRINERTISPKELQEIKEQLKEYGEILGIGFYEIDRKTSGKKENSADKLIGLLAEVRQKLREKKEWQLADEIRARLGELNISIEDSSAGGKKQGR
ncbi:MAG: cysteine--tRNA ligase [Methanothrix sp.]|nr:cysteine--tRNA ligase [Methanothrix sp.]